MVVLERIKPEINYGVTVADAKKYAIRVRCRRKQSKFGAARHFERFSWFTVVVRALEIFHGRTVRAYQ